MKHIFTLLALLLMALQSSWAQAPSQFNYQAVIRDNLNSIVARKDVAIKVSILQGSETGTPVYVETHKPTTNDNGLITLAIGGGTVVSGVFAKIEWPVGRFFLKTEIDPDANDNINNIITATSRLLAVPYAIHAQRATYAESAGGHQIGDLYGGGIIFSLWRDPQGVQHGLIASLQDVGSAVWGPNTFSGAVSPQNGAANTATIVAATGAGTAAGRCAAYRAGGFSDWYLPAIWELIALFNQAALINEIVNNDASAETNGLQMAIGQERAYWSSTEVRGSKNDDGVVEEEAMFYYPEESRSGPATKELNWSLRAIRKF